MTENAEPVHLILGWQCNTKGCDTFHFAKYLGEKDKLPPEGKVMPLNAQGRRFHIPCPRCNQTYFYHPKDLRSVEVTGPRPAELQDLL